MFGRGLRRMMCSRLDEAVAFSQPISPSEKLAARGQLLMERVEVCAFDAFNGALDARPSGDRLEWLVGAQSQ